jgi:hypothetical protein
MIRGLVALDELLEEAYGDAFALLDLAVLIEDPERLRALLAPFVIEATA